MRKLKRIGDHFTYQNIKEISAEPLLCDMCAQHSCPIRPLMKHIGTQQSVGAVADITGCKSFIPSLAFQSADGLTGIFNTIRLGHAWADRLKPGDIVALSKPGENPFGTAEVTDVHRGHLAEMLGFHGEMNHLAKHALMQGREIDMMRVMTNCYGKNRATTKARATVIYMRRL